MSVSVAHAADYSQPLPPPPVYVQPPPQEECCEGWYLRGFVGTGMTRATVDYITVLDASLQQSSVSDQNFIGAAIGYEWNSWLRFDVSAEYRAKSRVNAYVSYSYGGGTYGDIYEGQLKSWIFLANAFVDLGTWECFTPFVGFGIGAANNSLVDFFDTNQTTSGYGFGRNPSEWHLAWALYAGVSYNVTKTFKVDLTYRYLNYGSVTDTVDCANGGCSEPDSFKFGSLASHDIMLGFRWTFCCDIAPPQPKYYYAPPPVYTAPPPLRSRG